MERELLSTDKRETPSYRFESCPDYKKNKQMIKCIDKGPWTCISKSGEPKKSYDNSDAAISAAKLINKHNPKETTKLVAYKCTYCYKYHLLTVNKK
jgi:hypothetical protein